MIAFSCVHCGQKMKITEEEGSKKATCPKCGQAVMIPAASVGGRSGRRGRGSSSGSQTGEPTRLTPEGHPGVETRTGAGQAIHEVPTRVDGSPRQDDYRTSFLAPPEAPDEIGRLGPYRVLGVVGAGGMGIVFRAHDPQLDRIVALKAMLPNLAASATARQRFLREARAAAAIQHDHVVTLHQVGEDRGVPFLAMPFLRGESLDARLARANGPLPLEEALRIGREIAEGLAAIHDLGLIHRDIKPANVFLEGAAGRVKILDFGLARAASGEVQLTQEGAIVGSPAFMAPEQASRQPVAGTADLFSLGCVLYLMLTGALPFEGDDALSMLLAVQTGEPPTPADRCPTKVPVQVSELVMALLAKKAADRPASARVVVEVIRDLEG